MAEAQIPNITGAITACTSQNSSLWRINFGRSSSIEASGKSPVGETSSAFSTPNISLVFPDFKLENRKRDSQCVVVWPPESFEDYVRDRALLANATAGSVYSGIRVRRGVAKADWNPGQFRAVLVRMAATSGVLAMKIVSQCSEQARRVYNGSVFEMKKEIPFQGLKRLLSQLRFLACKC
jgi:hypothetical protein